MRRNTDFFAPNSVVCLMAPTASGKTALAYQLFETGKFELISVDSALVYCDMNIGTAKPSEDELLRYPHHLVDIISPTQSYSVADFTKDVGRLIGDIHKRGKIPLLIGGTMMYYMALFEGLSNVPSSDDKIRTQVEAWRQQDGIDALYCYLQMVDPILGERLKPTDTQRITRAVEVYKQTHTPLSVWQAQPKIALADNPEQHWYGLTVMPDRAWLHNRIAQRLDIMWQQGLVNEVIALIHKYPLTLDTPSMRCVGYRQVLEYLTTGNNGVVGIKNNILYAIVDNQQEFINRIGQVQHTLACYDMQNKALYATRQLAKRQYTWLRKFERQSIDTDCVNNRISDTTDDNLSNTNNNNVFVSFESMVKVEQFFTRYLNL